MARPRLLDFNTKTQRHEDSKELNVKDVGLRLCGRCMTLGVMAASVALFAAPVALGCSVPVFRYALEAWTPAPYEMLIFHRGKMNDADVALLNALRKSADDEKAPVNIIFTLIDVSEKMDERARKLWAEQKDAALPRGVLVYPDSGDAIWSGVLDAGLPMQLAASPARAEIARRIANGDSVVFVLLESGARELDAAAEALLAKELAGLQDTMALPKQDGEDDEFAPRRRQLGIPLRLRFTILKIARGDAKEKTFVDLLMKTDKKLSAAQPIVFPVFGRGRLLCALTGPALSSASLAECATFLSGACSCQVKELNPGVDLLMNVDWDTLLEDAVQAAAKNPKSKELPVAAPAASEKKPATPLPLTNAATPSEVVTADPAPGASNRGFENGGGSTKLLWAAIAAAAVFVVVTGRRALKSGNS